MKVTKLQLLVRLNMHSKPCGLNMHNKPPKEDCQVFTGMT